MKTRDLQDFKYGAFKVMGFIYIYIYIYIYIQLLTMFLCSFSDFHKSETTNEKTLNLEGILWNHWTNSRQNFNVIRSLFGF